MMQPAARPGTQEEIWNFILHSNFEVYFLSEKLESNVIFLYFKCHPSRDRKEQNKLSQNEVKSCGKVKNVGNGLTT